MATSNYALRLQKSLKSEAERVAQQEGTTLNQFINVAVAEKLAVLETADYFQNRIKNANIPKALKVLSRLGNKLNPQEGDEINRIKNFK